MQSLAASEDVKHYVPGNDGLPAETLVLLSRAMLRWLAVFGNRCRSGPEDQGTQLWKRREIHSEPPSGRHGLFRTATRSIGRTET